MPRALPARFVPPPGFGYPLGGFLPSNPRRSYFIPTALLRFALRSVPLRRGMPAFPPPCTHIPFAAALLPLAHGPARRSPVSGLSPPPESLAPRRVISTPKAGCSHGLCPSRVSRSATLPRIPPGAPLTRLARSRTRRVPRSCATEYQSVTASSRRNRHIAVMRGRNNPRRVSRRYDPEH
jgi:hypothetical protein